jgi:cytidylate kinase
MSLSLEAKVFNINNPLIIALDGPSAAGKGLIGKMLADQFTLKYFQSSLVYRGLAHLCVQQNVDPDDSARVIQLSNSPDIIEYALEYDLNDENIGSVASRISSITEARMNLSKHLVELVRTTHRLIMEGRDIGTVIAPNADLKIFLTADVNCRAERRFKQLRALGKECILHEILEQLKIRDARDQDRAFAPLIPATDALIIDTSNILPEQVIEVITNYIKTR